MTLAVDVVLGFVVGIAANFATDWIRMRLEPNPPGASSGRSAGGDLLWTLPSIAIPVFVLSLTRYRWVVTPLASAVLVAASFCAVVGLLWCVSGLSRAASQQRAVTWSLWIVALLAMGVTLDAVLPRDIAIDCPASPVPQLAAFSGRVLGGRSSIELWYGPPGSSMPHRFQVPVLSADGTWRADLSLNGDSDVWNVAAAADNGRVRSRLCTVALE